MPQSTQPTDQFLMGYLADDEHQSYVLFDRQWPEALQNTKTQLYCLHCDQIITMTRAIARQKFRKLQSHELGSICERLVDGYRSARGQFEKRHLHIATEVSSDTRVTSRASRQSPHAVIKVADGKNASIHHSLEPAPVSTWEAHKKRMATVDFGSATERGVTKEVGDLIDSLKEKFRAQISEIERRSDLSTEEKVGRLMHIACSVCAGVAIQPIPFADIFVLTPLQGYFGARIAAIRGVPISESEATDVTKEIIGLMGMAFIAQQLAIAIWKLFTFGAGGLLTIPLVYGLTFAIMKVIDAYYVHKAKGESLTKDQMKAMFKAAMAEGKKKGKKAEADVREGRP